MGISTVISTLNFHILALRFFISIHIFTYIYNKETYMSVFGKDFIVAAAKALVDAPEDVRVNIIEGEKTTVFELHVNEADQGKVIGKGGKTALAIRQILLSAGTKEGKRFSLEIIEKNKIKKPYVAPTT
jgi:hypothetical protein